MGGGKAYEKEKDVLIKVIKLGKDYMITCDIDGGWPIFSDISNLEPEQIQDIINNNIIGSFVGLVKLVNKEVK